MPGFIFLRFRKEAPWSQGEDRLAAFHFIPAPLGIYYSWSSGYFPIACELDQQRFRGKAFALGDHNLSVLWLLGFLRRLS